MAANRALGMFPYSYPVEFDQNLVQAAKKAVARTTTGEADVIFIRSPWKVKVLCESPLLLEIEDFLKDNMLLKLLASIKKGKYVRLP